MYFGQVARQFLPKGNNITKKYFGCIGVRYSSIYSSSNNGETHQNQEDILALSPLLKGYPSKIKINVAWGEMDSFQHDVNNVSYFRYLETGRIDYFHALYRQALKFSVDGIATANDLVTAEAFSSNK